MQKQKGICAYSQACAMPGPRISVPGTNQKMCGMHFRSLQLPIAAALPLDTVSRTEFRPRRRGRWATYVGSASIV